MESKKLKKTLNDLVDKVILLKSNEADSYRIHGLLKEKLKDDIKTYDGYGDYFVKVIDFIKNNFVDKEVEKCIKNIDTVYYPWLNRQPFSVIPHEQTDLKGSTFVIIPVPGYGNIKMMKVPGGEFDMHRSFRVAVDDFYIGETQVTQKLWQTVMGYNLSKFTPLNDDIRKFGISDTSYFPVENVSWYDCFVFIMNLNKLTKQKFRLPTEAEWEYAAGWRIDGKRNAYSGCDDVRDLRQYAWFEDGIPHKVATRHPNNLGIYDMSGNVYEWCQDWYGDYRSGFVINPTGPISGSSRVLRGGSWDAHADSCRVSYRRSYAPDRRSSYRSFRLLLSSPKKNI